MILSFSAFKMADLVLQTIQDRLAHIDDRLDRLAHIDNRLDRIDNRLAQQQPQQPQQQQVSL